MGNCTSISLTKDNFKNHVSVILKVASPMSPMSPKVASPMSPMSLGHVSAPYLFKKDIGDIGDMSSPHIVVFSSLK